MIEPVLLESPNDLSYLRRRVAELQTALDRSKQHNIIVLGWFQERDAWAKAWKEKAKHNRKGWKMEARKPWYRRRAWLELWESGR